MMKKIMSVLLCAAMAISLVACGGGGSQTQSGSGGGSTGGSTDGGKKVIKFFHRFPDEPYNGFIEAMIAEYEEAHPDIDIEISSAQNDPYKEKIKVLLGGDDAPDIFFSWPGEFSERFIREGLIMDMNPYFDADPDWKNSLMEAQMAQYTTDDGMVYGIPFRLDAKVWCYNKDVFEACGLTDADVPQTWDQFLSVCQTIKDNGYVPIAFGNVEKWAGSLIVGGLINQIVPESVVDTDFIPETATFTDPAYVTALEHLEKLIPYMSDGAAGMEWGMSRSSFVQNKAAFFYPEVVEVPYILNENADVNMGLFSFPLVEDGKGNPEVIPGSPEGFVVSANTQYPDECMEFLKWFLGGEVGARQASEILWFNASKDAVSGITDPMLVDAYEVIANAKKLSPWFDNVVYSTVKEEWYTQISNIFTGEATPEQALDSVIKITEESKELLQLESGE